MAGINKAIIVGRLGKDPELRRTQNQNAVGNMSIATSEKYKDKDGQYQERTEWHRIVTWGKTAELCAKYLTKGGQAYVEGRLQTRKWTDKDGAEKYSTEIVADKVQFLDSASNDNKPKPTTSSNNFDQLDDIPF